MPVAIDKKSTEVMHLTNDWHAVKSTEKGILSTPTPISDTLRVVNKTSALDFDTFAYNSFKTKPLIVMTRIEMIAAANINNTAPGTDLLILHWV